MLVGSVQVTVEDDDPHHLGSDEEQRHEHDHDGKDDGQPDVTNGPRYGRHHDSVADVVQPLAHPILKGAERRRTPWPVVREVGGEDEERFDERDGEDEQGDPGKDGRTIW